jgi:DNA-binding MarR family transcriptional regulator
MALKVFVGCQVSTRVRLRDIAAACHITERIAQSIVTDLEDDGYLRRERDGRRTR